MAEEKTGKPLKIDIPSRAMEAPEAKKFEEHISVATKDLAIPKVAPVKIEGQYSFDYPSRYQPEEDQSPSQLRSLVSQTNEDFPPDDYPMNMWVKLFRYFKARVNKILGNHEERITKMEEWHSPIEGEDGERISIGDGLQFSDNTLSVKVASPLEYGENGAITVDPSALGSESGNYVTTGNEDQSISGRKIFHDIAVGMIPPYEEFIHNWLFPFVYHEEDSSTLAGIALSQWLGSQATYSLRIFLNGYVPADQISIDLEINKNFSSGVTTKKISLSDNPPLNSNDKSIATTSYTLSRIEQVAQDRINTNLDLWVDAEAGADDPNNEDPARGLTAQTAFKTINAAIQRATMVWRLYSSGGHIIRIILKNFKSDGTAQFYNETVCLCDGIAGSTTSCCYMLQAQDCSESAVILPKVYAIDVAHSHKWGIRGLHLIGNVRNVAQIYAYYDTQYFVDGPMIFDVTNMTDRRTSAIKLYFGSHMSISGNITLRGNFYSFLYAFNNGYAIMASSGSLNLDEATCSGALFCAAIASTIQLNCPAGFATPASWQGGQSYYLCNNSFINTDGGAADLIPGTAGYKDESSLYL